MRAWLLLWLLLAGPAQASITEQVCGPDGLPETLPDTPPSELGQALLAVFRCPLPASDSTAINRVRVLLDAGAPLDISDDTGNTALHAALAHSDERTDGPVHFYRDAARLLLARGADPLASNSRGTQPLHLAAREAQGQVTQLLLDLGADPLAEDGNGRSALQYAASASDNLNTFALLLRASQTQQPLDADDLQTLAGLAAARHDHGKLNLLLELSPELSLDRTDATASLARALWQGAPLALAQRLSDAGADPAALAQMGGADLPWRLATLGRAAELDWLLEAGFALNTLPPSGIPPLFYATPDATRMLLARGADPALSSADSGPTAAALTPPPPPFDEGGEVIGPEKLALLLDAGYPPDHTDPQGRTALEHAVRADAHWLTRSLLDAGASPLISSDARASVLPLAVQHARTTTLQLLLRAVPDAMERHPDLLLVALELDDPRPLPLEALLVAGFDTEARNGRGETPLLVAARRQLWPLVTLLLRYGADPAAINHSGCGLRCYAWSMPETVYDRLAPHMGQAEPGWQPATLNQRPAGFFAVALAPTLLLWLLLCGHALLRQRSLLPASSWLVMASISGVLAAGALFYQCDPCLLQDPEPQMALTALLSAVIFVLLAWRHLRPARASAQDTGHASQAASPTPASAEPAPEEITDEPASGAYPDALQPTETERDAPPETPALDDWLAPAEEEPADNQRASDDTTPRGFW